MGLFVQLIDTNSTNTALTDNILGKILSFTSFFSFFEAMQAIENAIIYKCVFDSCFNHLFRSCRFRESIFILFRKVKQCF